MSVGLFIVCIIITISTIITFYILFTAGTPSYPGNLPKSKGENKKS